VITETFKAEQTRRLLWSHAARQVIATLPQMSEYDCVSVGCGWGLRQRSAGRQRLVLHPSSNAPERGDLALTALGDTHVVPRCGASYVEYLCIVAEAVEAMLNAHHAHRLQP
jgi:hypothetical protein